MKKLLFDIEKKEPKERQNCITAILNGELKPSEGFKYNEDYKFRLDVYAAMKKQTLAEINSVPDEECQEKYNEIKAKVQNVQDFFNNIDSIKKNDTKDNTNQSV